MVQSPPWFCSPLRLLCCWCNRVHHCWQATLVQPQGRVCVYCLAAPPQLHVLLAQGGQYLLLPFDDWCVYLLPSVSAGSFACFVPPIIGTAYSLAVCVPHASPVCCAILASVLCAQPFMCSLPMGSECKVDNRTQCWSSVVCKSHPVDTLCQPVVEPCNVEQEPFMCCPRRLPPVVIPAAGLMHQPASVCAVSVGLCSGCSLWQGMH